MTWLAPKLKNRVQIGKPTQAANDVGGFDFGFDTVLTVWCEFLPMSVGSFIRARYIRGEQTELTETHTFKIRRTAVSSLGKAFTKGFSTGFDSIPDLNPLKSDYFLFVQKGNASKGRLFLINGIMNNDEADEYIRITAEEVEERGTGYPAEADPVDGEQQPVTFGGEEVTW